MGVAGAGKTTVGECLAERLDSQFAVLKPPGADENPISVSIDQPIDRIVEHIAAQLRAGPELPRRGALTG
jgi:gluconate kinase